MTKKYEVMSDGEFGFIMENLNKSGGGHKYKSRKPAPGGGYTYEYEHPSDSKRTITIEEDNEGMHRMRFPNSKYDNKTSEELGDILDNHEAAMDKLEESLDMVDDEFTVGVLKNAYTILDRENAELRERMKVMEQHLKGSKKGKVGLEVGKSYERNPAYDKLMSEGKMLMGQIERAREEYTRATSSAQRSNLKSRENSLYRQWEEVQQKKMNTAPFVEMGKGVDIEQGAKDMLFEACGKGYVKDGKAVIDVLKGLDCEKIGKAEMAEAILEVVEGEQGAVVKAYGVLENVLRKAAGGNQGGVKYVSKHPKSGGGFVYKYKHDGAGKKNVYVTEEASGVTHVDGKMAGEHRDLARQYENKEGQQGWEDTADLVAMFHVSADVLDYHKDREKTSVADTPLDDRILESMNSGKPLQITAEEWKDKPKDYKGITDGKKTMMVYVPNKGTQLWEVEVVKEGKVKKDMVEDMQKGHELVGSEDVEDENGGSVKKHTYKHGDSGREIAVHESGGDVHVKGVKREGHALAASVAEKAAAEAREKAKKGGDDAEEHIDSAKFFEKQAKLAKEHADILDHHEKKKNNIDKMAGAVKALGGDKVVAKEGAVEEVEEDAKDEKNNKHEKGESKVEEKKEEAEEKKSGKKEKGEKEDENAEKKQKKVEDKKVEKSFDVMGDDEFKTLMKRGPEAVLKAIAPGMREMIEKGCRKDLGMPKKPESVKGEDYTKGKDGEEAKREHEAEKELQGE